MDGTISMPLVSTFIYSFLIFVSVVLSTFPTYASDPTLSSLELGLLRSSKDGRVEEVRELLQVGIDANARDTGGWTPLMFAANGGHVAVVRTLLEAGADPNVASKGGVTAVFISASKLKKSGREMMEVLVGAGADLNAINREGLTPLISSIAQKNVATASALLELGADPNKATKDGSTPIIIALLSRSDTYAKPELLQRLLASGADPNASHQGVTPLALAILRGDTRAGEALALAGANPKVAVAPGVTPLSLAQSKQLRKLYALLSALPERASVASSGSSEATRETLITAILKKDVDAVKQQVAAGVDVNDVDSATGWSPLMFAAQIGDVQIIQQLLIADATVDHTAKDGTNSITIAALNGHTKAFESLARRGGKAEEVTVLGQTPRSILTLKTNSKTINDCDRLAADKWDTHRRAEGVDKIDYVKAIPACRAALKIAPNNPRLQFQLGRALSQRLYREKHLSNKSEVEAQVKTLFSSAAQKGHPGAMLEYAHILYRTHSDHDESKANRLNIKYLLDAAERGHLMGMELLAYQLDVGFGFDGRLNFDDGIFRNQNLGMQWFRVAAEQGSATAMFELGRRLQTGIPTISKPNYRRALFWLTKATELGQASAYFHLAVMYDRGWAVERSVVQAATYIYRNIKIDDVEALIHLRDRRLHTVISRAVWKKLQVFMRNDGFYEGAIDGLYGVAMRKALHKAGGKKIRKSLAR